MLHKKGEYGKASILESKTQLSKFWMMTCGKMHCYLLLI